VKTKMLDVKSEICERGGIYCLNLRGRGPNKTVPAVPAATMLLAPDLWLQALMRC
jgi:hypothetical protein